MKHAAEQLSIRSVSSAPYSPAHPVYLRTLLKEFQGKMNWVADFLQQFGQTSFEARGVHPELAGQALSYGLLLASAVTEEELPAHLALDEELGREPLTSVRDISDLSQKKIMHVVGLLIHPRVTTASVGEPLWEQFNQSLRHNGFPPFPANMPLDSLRIDTLPMTSYEFNESHLIALHRQLEDWLDRGGMPDLSGSPETHGQLGHSRTPAQ